MAEQSSKGCLSYIRSFFECKSRRTVAPDNTLVEKNPTLIDGNLLAGPHLQNATSLYKYQVDALWPHEAPLLRKVFDQCLSKYQSNDSIVEIRLLDIGCGTGELLTRLIGENGLFEKDLKPNIRLHIEGVELDTPTFNLCTQRLKDLKRSENVTLKIHQATAFKLPFASDRFDIILNRHMLHCVPREKIGNTLSEIYRVLKPGGVAHFVVEDIEMIYTSATDDETITQQQQLWSQGLYRFGEKLGVDLRIGRKLPTMLKQKGFSIDLSHLAVVDTVNLNRTLLINIFDLWHRMYSDAFKLYNMTFQYDHTFGELRQSIRDQGEYIAWYVPIFQGSKPTIERRHQP